MIRSPVTWLGGKGNSWRNIVPWLDRYPHQVFVDVFGGGANILLNKRPAKLETYNDVDRALYELFRVLTEPDLRKRFLEEVQYLPYSRDFFYEYRETWQDEIDIVRRVVRWFLVARQSFGGVFGEGWGYGVDPMTRRSLAEGFQEVLRALPAVIARLQRVQIENQDFRRILKAYDAPGTLFYLDPPYVPATRRAGEYKHEMTIEDHEEMVATVLDLGRVCIVSGYDHESYRPLEAAGYAKHVYTVRCHVAGKTGANKGRSGNQRRVECLWLHPDVVRARQPSLFRSAR